MKLTILERTKLLEALPAQENILTIKILRKLKETLSFSEEELKTFGAVNEFACPYRGEGAVVIIRASLQNNLPVGSTDF